MQPDITVIIPVFNEYDGVPFLVDSLNDFFSIHREWHAEVIFVNDGSSDNTVQRLSEWKHENYDGKLINFSKNYGSHAALRAGISVAKGKHVCFNYADLQDPLEIIVPMMALANEGNEIVWATRETAKQSFAEKIFSRFYASMMQKFAFANFPEKGFDIVMFDRKVAEAVNKNPEANSSIFLQILGLGFRQASITYKKRERKTGASKWTLSKKIKLFIDSFVAFSYAPIRMVSIMGILFFLAGAFWTAYVVFRKLLVNDLDPGWPALTSILLLGFGITNIALGIIAEYLWRTLDAARGRPIYIIESMKELK